MKLSISLLVLCAFIATFKLSAASHDHRAYFNEPDNLEHRNYNASEPFISEDVVYADNLIIRPGDIQLTKFMRGKIVYKSRVLFDKQRYITKYMHHKISRPEWAGQYFAFNKEVAESYGADYLTNGKGGYYLKEYELDQLLYVLKIKNQAFADPTISQEIKARKLKEFFKMYALGNIEYQQFYNKKPVDQQLFTKFDDLFRELRRNFETLSVPLITTLGASKVAVECPHDRSNYELIVPENMDLTRLFTEIKSEVVVVDPRMDTITRYPSLTSPMSAKDRTIIDDQKAAVDKEIKDSQITIVD